MNKIMTPSEIMHCHFEKMEQSIGLEFIAYKNEVQRLKLKNKCLKSLLVQLNHSSDSISEENKQLWSVLKNLTNKKNVDLSELLEEGQMKEGQMKKTQTDETQTDETQMEETQMEETQMELVPESESGMESVMETETDDDEAEQAAAEAEAEAVAEAEADAELEAEAEAEAELEIEADAEGETEAEAESEEESEAEAEEAEEEAEEAEEEAEEEEEEEEEEETKVAAESKDEVVAQKEEVVEEEEEEEVYPIVIDGVNYFTTNEKTGMIYSVTTDGEVGEEVGYYEDGEPGFYE